MEILPPSENDQYTVEAGREFSVTCQSTGEFSGEVQWIPANLVPDLGSHSGPCVSVPLMASVASMAMCICTFSNLLPCTVAESVFGDSQNNEEANRRLFSRRLSRNEVVLTTANGFGISLQAEGEYICFVNNNITTNERRITVSISGSY